MRSHERVSFARCCSVPIGQIATWDLLNHRVTVDALSDVDVVLLGGSGHYSAAGEGDWLDRALDSLRTVYETGTPTFASCWGFQAMARALGGEVVRLAGQAEVGTYDVFLTDAGRTDPIFGKLPGQFPAQMGHEDHVVALPHNAVAMAYSNLAAHQAYCLTDRPVYCTQFHPELERDDLIARLTNYPEYAEKVAGLDFNTFEKAIRETPEAASLVRRFLEYYFGT